MARKRKKHRSLILKLIVIAIILLIGYVWVFSLIPISSSTSTIMTKLVRTAVKIKFEVINNYAFYSIALLLLVSILIPTYLKIKK